jgi:hypothetical protein
MKTSQTSHLELINNRIICLFDKTRQMIEVFIDRRWKHFFGIKLLL